MPQRQASITGTFAFAFVALAALATGAFAQDSPAAGDSSAVGWTSPLSGYYIGSWFDWVESLVAAYGGGSAAGGAASQEAPFGTGGLAGPSFGGGYSFPVKERGTLGFYGALNLPGLASDAPGETPALYGYSRSTPFRTRLGGRYTHVFSSRLRGFFGLGWDYGFGDVRFGSRTPRIPLNAPEGSSAFAEMGLKISDFGDFSFDISTYGLSSGNGGDSVGGMNMIFTF
jgi:hypothetical protein